MILRRLSLALLLCSALAPSIAHAQQVVSDGDKAAARQLTIDGHAALAKGDFVVAADLFGRADKLFHAPTVTLGLARAQVGLGKLLNAQELYNRLVHEPLPATASDSFTRAVDDGRTELAALAPRIPSLIIQVKGADAPRVTLDGADVPAAVLGVKRPVDPGKHVVRAVAKRSLPSETAVTVAEGKIETVTLTLAPAPAGTPDAPDAEPPAANVRLPDSTASVRPPDTMPYVPPPPPRDAGDTGGSVRKPVGLAVLGVGVVGLVVGAATAGLAASKRSTLIQACPTGHCPASLEPSLQGDVDSMHTMATVSTAGFVVGGALAATGLILVVTAPKAMPRAGVLPLVGPGFVGMSGRF